MIFLLLLAFGWREYQNNILKKDLISSYNAVIDFNEKENDQLKESLDLKVSDNFIMKQNVISEKVANQKFREELAEYKKINSYMKSEVVTSINNLEVKYKNLSKDQFDGIDIKDGEYIHKDIVNKNFLRVPDTIYYNDDWMSLIGTINKQGAIIDSLYMFNKFDAVIGYKKPEKNFKWLRKKEPVVELKSYNPYTKINYVNNVTVDNNKGKVKNIFTSPIALFAYGFIGATALN